MDSRLKMLFQRNKKGDINIEMVLVILAVIALFVLMGVPEKLKSLISDFAGDVEEAFADCDLDGIENKIDRCPCLSTLGDSEKEPNLIGCPVPTTTLIADNDRKTCTTYEISDGKYSEKCDKDNPKDCKTRCDDVHGKSTIVEDRRPGIETDGDLTVEVKKFLTLENSALSPYVSYNEHPPERRVEFDLVDNNQIWGTVNNLPTGSHITVPIQLAVKNGGSGTISHNFAVQVFICDEVKSNCLAKGSLPITEELKHNQEIPISFNLVIGNNGDYCDGEGTRSCYVKIKVDSDEKGNGILSETNEKNNEVFILARLVGQTNIETFPLYQIMAVIDDGSDGDMIDEYGYCQGDSDTNKALREVAGRGSTDPLADYFSLCLQQFTQKWESTDGEFPKEVASAGNCWVFAVEADDADDDDIGAAPVAQGERIEYGTTKTITPAGGLIQDPDNKISTVFEKPWSSNKGGLICKKDWWHRCDSAHKGNVLMINEQRFVCNNQNWEPRN